MGTPNSMPHSLMTPDGHMMPQNGIAKTHTAFI